MNPIREFFKKDIVLKFGLFLLVLAQLNWAYLTRIEGGDFEIYYQTGFYFLRGLPIYDFSRDGFYCFKYPPWIATFFIPFSFISMGLSKWIWGLLNGLCVIWIVKLLRRQGASWLALIVAHFLFWTIWQSHARWGQFAVIPLYFAILGFELMKNRAGVGQYVGGVMLFGALSSKVFQILTLLPVWLFQRKLLLRSVAVAALVFGVWSLAMFAFVPEHSVAEWVRSYLAAINSSSTYHATRQFFNQGLPIMFWRVGVLFVSNEVHDVVAFVAVALFFTVRLVLARRILNYSELFYAALAASCISSPLAWKYNYVWTFPLGVAAFDGALAFGRTRRGWQAWVPFAVVLLGFAMIGLMSSQTIGPVVGAWLEKVSIKAWGAVVLLEALIYVKRRALA